MIESGEVTVPCLIYSAEVVRRQHDLLRSFLDVAYPNSRIFYALKACYCPPLVQLLVRMGCGLELLSADERSVASCLRLSGKSLIWNGCSLSDEVLRRVVKGGEYLNVDSPDLYHELSAIANEEARTVEIGLRLNMTGKGKSGMSLQDAKRLLKTPASNLRCTGFQFHGSPRAGEDLDTLINARRDFVRLVRDLESEFDLHLSYLDLGGGLLSGVPLERQLLETLACLRDLRSKPQLFLEPGAFLVEDAGVALTQVIAVKTIGDTKWAVVDIGANLLIPLNRARYHVDGHDFAHATGELVNIGGALGMSADVIALDQRIAVERGSTLRIRGCGAYTGSMSSFFVSAPPPVYWDDGSVLRTIPRCPLVGDLFLAFHGYDTISDNSDP